MQFRSCVLNVCDLCVALVEDKRWCLFVEWSGGCVVLLADDMCTGGTAIWLLLNPLHSGLH